MALGVWITINPDKAAELTRSAQRRGGVTPCDRDEPQILHQNELGIWFKPGDRARSMRLVGIAAVVVGLGSVLYTVTGFAA